MRILQVIDSLEIGGAERMAINYANALANKVSFSGIVVTRKEGFLKEKISENVNYFFLDRKKRIDLKAILKFRAICKKNKVTHLQAHSSSFFIAFLVKLILPKIKIIWHDHNGLSEFVSKQKSFILKITSFFFSGIIVVNDKLKKWSEKELNCKNIIYLPNFTTIEKIKNKQTKLHGHDNKRILCLANLRFQKNHFFLIEVAKICIQKYPDWSFHLVGKDFNDDYSKNVKDLIKVNKLENNVFLYGSKSDVQNIIEQSEIVILTSQSEGLPVVVIEFGLNKKAFVSTIVGEIPNIIINGENGLLSDKTDFVKFSENLSLLIENDVLRKKLGANLYATIYDNYSENKVLNKFLNWVN